MHKGFKCLEVNTSWVYVSRDVVFDEHVFPFAKLHPNAGALLRQEISLLSLDLVPYSFQSLTKVLVICWAFPSSCYRSSRRNFG